MKNGMIRIGMFEAYLERMLIRGLKVAYISYFTRTLQEAKAIASTMCTTEQNTIWLNNNGPEKRYNVVGIVAGRCNGSNNIGRMWGNAVNRECEWERCQ